MFDYSRLKKFEILPTLFFDLHNHCLMDEDSANDHKLKHRKVIDFLTHEGATAKDISQRMNAVYGMQFMGMEPPLILQCAGGIASLSAATRASTMMSAPEGLPQSREVTPENSLLMRDQLDADRRQSVRTLSDLTGLPNTTILRILHDHLHMSKVCARWVPIMLNPLALDKQRRVSMFQELLARYYMHPELLEATVITEDETWLHHYDPETKAQSSQFKHPEEPAPRKFKSQRFAGKVLTSVFWDSKGVRLCDFLSQGNTI